LTKGRIAREADFLRGTV